MSQLNIPESSLSNTLIELPLSSDEPSLISPPTVKSKRVSSPDRITPEHPSVDTPGAQSLETLPLLSSPSSYVLRSPDHARSSPCLFSEPSVPASPDHVPRVNTRTETPYLSFDIPEPVNREQYLTNSEVFESEIFSHSHSCSEPLAPNLPPNCKLISILEATVYAVSDAPSSEVQPPTSADLNMPEFLDDNRDDQLIEFLQFPFVETRPLDMEAPRGLLNIDVGLDPFASIELNSPLQWGPQMNEADFQEFLHQFSITPASHTQKIAQLEMFRRQESYLQQYIKFL